MRFLNKHTSSIDDVAPGTIGYGPGGAIAEHYDRLGMIQILDRKASAPPPEATPEAISKLTVERDALMAQNDNLKAEIERLKSEVARLAALPAAAPEVEITGAPVVDAAKDDSKPKGK